MAESTTGLFKTEVIKFPGPWTSAGQVERETLKWVDWYNKTRAHSAIGYVAPNEAEEKFCTGLNADEKAAKSLNNKLAGKTGAVHSAGRVRAFTSTPWGIGDNGSTKKISASSRASQIIAPIC